MINEYLSQGYYLAKGLLPRSVVRNLLQDMRSVFGRVTDDSSDEGIISLFENKFDQFYGAANICQWTVPLFQLSSCAELVCFVNSLGLQKPVVNTRPLVSYSSRRLAKNDSYWKVPAHQDWPSTQGSLNGITLWVPLVDVPKRLGALEVVPESHLLGNLDHVEVDGVPILDHENWNFVSVPMEVGDVLAFSNFLIHRSGLNATEDQIRWSAHFRYDDLEEETFIQRNFPHHRTDKRVPGLLHPDFPSKEQLGHCFKSVVK